MRGAQQISCADVLRKNIVFDALFRLLAFALWQASGFAVKADPLTNCRVIRQLALHYVPSSHQR
jgi:hypothetical protein